MKTLFLYQFFLFKIIISNPVLNYIKNEEKNATIKDIFLQLIQNEKNNIIKIFNNTNNQNCTDFLSENYISNIDSKNESKKNQTYLYYVKLALDSSKNKNDISTYRDCMKKRYGINLEKDPHFSYVLVFIDKRNQTPSNFYEDTTYLFALCLVYQDKCKDENYEEMFNTFYQIYVNQSNITKNETTVFSFEDSSNEYIYTFFSINQIPLYIIIFIFFLMVFKKLIIKLFNLINYSKKEKEKKDIQNRKAIKGNNYNFASQSQKINYQKLFESVFSLSKNIDILFNNENEEDIYNDTGINYIKGMKGLSMIFYLLGTLYFNLYNSPISQKNRRKFYESLGNYLNCFFYIGLKYSPRILLSCSGFSLFYKFIHYLDEKTEEKREEKREEKKEEKREERKRKKKNHSFLYYTNIGMLFTFIIHQIYKYILFLLVVFFMLYTIFSLNLAFIDINPMWVYFNHSVLLTKISFPQLISLLFGFQTYSFPDRNQDNILNYFWLLYNEIFFFLLTIIILYFIYKYNLQFNRIIILLFFLIEIFKFIFSYFIYNLYPALIFTFYNYGKFYVTSFMNYPYFLIGIYFSMFNYTMQKRLNYGDCERQGKHYLKPILKAIKKIENYKKNNLYKCGTLLIIILIIFCLSPFIIFTIIELYNNNDKLNIYFRNNVTRFIMMYDSEIIVFLLHFLLFFFNISEENIIKDISSHSKWNLFDRTYFSYILLINPIILYILYTGETKIQFNKSNCLLYSLISFFFVFVLSILFYLFFELPFKRIIKYIFKIKQNKKKEQILGNIEDQFNIISHNSSNFFDIVSEEEDKNEEEESLTNKINQL